MPTCTQCDSFVTHDFVRVFGDNAERVAGCIHCMSIGEFVSDKGVDTRSDDAQMAAMLFD